MEERNSRRTGIGRVMKNKDREFQEAGEYESEEM
jgi:hypothetical protein